MPSRENILVLFFSVFVYKVAVDAALEMNDLAIVVDLLGILTLRPWVSS